MNDVVTTAAVILKYANVGEADRIYHLVTSHKGRIIARATGVRHLKSKLRFLLQPTRMASISIIEGKRGYRIVNAYSPTADSLLDDRIRIPFLILVDRLVQGETDDVRIYEHIESVLSSKAKTVTRDDQKGVYGSAVLLLLDLLGYYSPSDMLRESMKDIIAAKKDPNSLIQDVPDPGSLIKSILISTQL